MRWRGYLTFIVESVYSVDTRAFVVTAENEEVFGVFYLQVCSRG
jgi:uncharacterized protein YebE (UPF0316 family)